MHYKHKKLKPKKITTQQTKGRAIKEIRELGQGKKAGREL